MDEFFRRHAVCGLDKASITTVSPQCSRIKLYFPTVQIPMYSLIECYRNAITNIVYTKQYYSTEEIESTDELMPSREKCNYNSLELLNLATVVCNQARDEIKRFNAVLNAW